MNPTTPAIRAIAYSFPEASRSVRDLHATGLLRTDAATLERFGFDRVHTATTETPYGLARAATASLLERTGVDPDSVGLLVYGGVQGATAFDRAPTPEASAASHRTTARFRYPGTRLQHELGLRRAQVIGVDQLACASLFAAVRLARALCLTEGIERAVCVAAEFFPADAGREAVYNCTSDAAVAVLVERDGARNRIASTVHVTKGYYWDPDALQNEMVAAYFPTAMHVLEGTIAAAGWRPEDVDWVIPHNVGRPSWEILLRLARLERARLWMDNLARDGHTLAGDNFINLADALESGEVSAGQKLVLFSFGYGAHWTGMALES